MKYRDLVESTKNKDLDGKDQLANAAIGLCGEAGEVADLIKKLLYHGKKVDMQKLWDEIGDVRWYLELLCIETGTTMEFIEAKNIQKLMTRYPNGFSHKASEERKDVKG